VHHLRLLGHAQTNTFFNETTNETISSSTPNSDFYLFTINAGGRVRNRLKLTTGSNGMGMWQIPAISTHVPLRQRYMR
jgi:hypothetical protein